MKIAWVTYDFEEYSTLHVNALAGEHEVLLVMPAAQPGESTYPIDSKVEHYAFNKPRLRQPLRQVRSVRGITAAIDAFSPDVVHWQQGHLWFNWAIRSLQRYPLVVTIHDPRHHAGDRTSQKTPQWVMDYGFRLADHAIVHGQALVPQVCDLFNFTRQRVHVIPHVAMGQGSLDCQSGERFDSGSPVDSEPNTILFFGRIWEYKGLRYLIDAMPRIRQSVPDAKIIIAGEGDDFEQYQQMIGDAEGFEIHNRWISDGERAAFFQRASVVVLPYTEATQSGVVPVAQAHARPVVATDVGALRECVSQGETGTLVPPADAEALADAIVGMLQDPLRAQGMGLAGRDWLSRTCSPEAVAAQTADVYRQALADKLATSPC